MADNSQSPGQWPTQQQWGAGPSGSQGSPSGSSQGGNPYGQQYPQSSAQTPWVGQQSQPGYAGQQNQPGYAAGQSPYGQSSSQYGYGQPAAYPQQPYPQQGSGQQVYAVQPGYGSAQTAYQAQPATRSPLLGMISLGVVVVCGVLMAYLFYRAGDIAGGLMATSGPRLDQEQLQAELMARMSTVELMLWNFTMLGGMAAWICGIVATATKRGRGYGIWAIVLGVLAPIAAIAAMFVSLMPYLNR